MRLMPESHPGSQQTTEIHFPFTTPSVPHALRRTTPARPSPPTDWSGQVTSPAWPQIDAPLTFSSQTASSQNAPEASSVTYGPDEVRVSGWAAQPRTASLEAFGYRPGFGYAPLPSSLGTSPDRLGEGAGRGDDGEHRDRPCRTAIQHPSPAPEGDDNTWDDGPIVVPVWSDDQLHDVSPGTPGWLVAQSKPIPVPGAWEGANWQSRMVHPTAPLSVGWDASRATALGSKRDLFSLYLAERDAAATRRNMAYAQDSLAIRGRRLARRVMRAVAGTLVGSMMAVIGIGMLPVHNPPAEPQPVPVPGSTVMEPIDAADA